MTVVLPTLEDVAREAGVSRATASRAVRGAGRVSSAARRAVDEAVARLGYVPNQAARSLVTRESDVVALLVSEPDRRIFSDPFFGSAISGVVDALAGTTKQLVLAMRTSDEDARLHHFLTQSAVDGVVVLSHHAADDFTEILTTRAIPTVFVGRPLHGDSVAFVDMDNVAGGRLAAQHLVQRGARHLAIIGGPSDMPAAQDRHAGWEEALAEAGVVPVARYEGDFTAQSAVSATQRLLVEHPEVDGLFVASDPMAIASLGVLRAAGRSVPGDVRVVGFDDTDAAREADLTTVTNPADVLTATATSMVLDLIAGDPVVAPVIVQPRLVRRHSS